MTFVNLRQILSTTCIVCGAEAVYDKTKLATALFNHIYKCTKCYALIGVPTMYSKCDKFGVISKDLHANDCLMCLVPKLENLDPKKCPYFKGKITYKELLYHINKMREKEDVEIRTKDDGRMPDVSKIPISG